MAAVTATARTDITGYCSVARNDIVKIGRWLAEQPHREHGGGRAEERDGGVHVGLQMQLDGHVR